MSEDKPTRRSLTHAEYHKTCLYLGGLAVQNMIDHKLLDLARLIKRDTGVAISKTALRRMIRELGYSYADGNPATLVLQHQVAIAELREDITTLATRVMELAALIHNSKEQDNPPPF